MSRSVFQCDQFKVVIHWGLFNQILACLYALPIETEACRSKLSDIFVSRTRCLTWYFAFL